MEQHILSHAHLENTVLQLLLLLIVLQAIIAQAFKSLILRMYVVQAILAQLEVESQYHACQVLIVVVEVAHAAIVQMANTAAQPN